MEITNRDDLRVGDTATFDYDGHEFTGDMWVVPGRAALWVGPTVARYGDGEWNELITFVRAAREMPSLPTEPGSVILVTECRGERADEPVVAWWDDVEGSWLTSYRFDGWTGHDADDITEWAPAKVVPA